MGGPDRRRIASGALRAGHRWAGVLLALLLVGGLLPAHPALGAGEWHFLDLPPGTAPVGVGAGRQVVFLPRPAPGQPLPGFIAVQSTSSGGAISVVPFWLPDDGLPFWDPTAAEARIVVSQTSTPKMRASGSVVLVTAENANTIDRFDGTSWQLIGPAPAPTNLGSVAVDARAPDRVLVGHRFAPGGIDLLTSGGTAWTPVAAFSGLTIASAAISGSRWVIQEGTGNVLNASSDDGATISPFVGGAFAEISAPPGTTGAFWGVGAFARYGTIDDNSGSWVVTNTPGPAGTAFVAIERLGAEAWVLDGTGVVHRQFSGDAPTWTEAPGAYQVTGTGLTRAYDLAVLGVQEAVAVGDDGAENPRIAWRNRPPLLPSLIDGSVEEGPGGDDQVEATALDPDGETVTYTWSCTDGGVGSWNLSGSPTTLTVPDSGACPGEPTYPITCDLTAEDLESATGPASGTVDTVVVDVTPTDLVPPTVDTLTLSDATGVLPAPATVEMSTPVTAELVAADDCGVDLAATTWRVLDASATPVAGLTGTGGSFAFDAPDPGGAAQTFTVEVTFFDVNGNQALDTTELTVVAAPVVLDLSCPGSVVAGESATASATVVSGTPTALTWSLVDPAAAPATLTANGEQAVVVTELCGVLPPGQGWTLTVTPEGPSGGSPVSCTVGVTPGALSPELALAGAPDPLVWQLPASGGEFVVDPGVSYLCGGALVSASWDLRGLPPELLPAETLGGGLDQAVIGPVTLSASEAEVATVLGATGVFEGAFTVTASYLPGDWHTDPAHPHLTVAHRLRIVPSPRVETALSLLDLGELGPGEIVAAQVEFRSDVPVSAVSLAVATRGLSLVPGSRVEVVSACASPTVEARESEAGFELQLDAVPADCDLELTVLLRVGWGAGSLELTDCAWREGPMACEGRAALGRAGMFGCTSAEGSSSGGLLGLLLLSLATLRRRGS